MEYQLQLRRQQLVTQNGFRTWQTEHSTQTIAPQKLAIVVVDMWNQHWCRGANERVAPMLPKMDAMLRRARDNGVLIVHAPSDCMPFYQASPARARALAVPALPCPTVQEVPGYAPPLDSSDHGSDTENDVAPPNTGVWFRQHEALHIDEDRDIISDSGDGIYANLKHRGVQRVIYTGVHTNMCIMCRPFAIIAMRKAGFETALVRDLTDPMYNPAQKPYVSHEEGKQLMLGYIEKFWCPTLESEQL